jgi:hypothetical protein
LFGLIFSRKGVSKMVKSKRIKLVSCKVGDDVSSKDGVYVYDEGIFVAIFEKITIRSTKITLI